MIDKYYKDFSNTENLAEIWKTKTGVVVSTKRKARPLDLFET